MSNAIQTRFNQSTWQRYQVHFMRNVMDRLPKINTEQVRTDLELFRVHHIQAARIAIRDVLDKYESKYHSMCDCLDSGLGIHLNSRQQIVLDTIDQREQIF